MRGWLLGDRWVSNERQRARPLFFGWGGGISDRTGLRGSDRPKPRLAWSPGRRDARPVGRALDRHQHGRAAIRPLARRRKAAKRKTDADAARRPAAGRRLAPAA